VTGATRIRQAVLVAQDYPGADAAIRAEFGLDEPFHDPGVGQFGLRNGVFTVGDCFLEVVSPTREGTAAGRYRERIGGDGGYMVMIQLPDIASARQRLAGLGVRIVFDGEHPDIADIHLHPKDVPGAIVALNQPRPPGSWRYGGPAWEAKVPTEIAPGGITGLTVRAPDPDWLAARWAEVAGLARTGRTLHLDGQTIEFVTGEPEGICGIGLALPGAAAAEVHLHGVTFAVRPA
jgi:hypothetical protein